MTRMLPLAEMDMSRVQWMGERAPKIYGPWVRELVTACDTPDFWQSYEQLLQKEIPSIKTGYVLNPDPAIGFMVHEEEGAMMQADRRLGLCRELILPYKEEILTYTSAADFLTSKGAGLQSLRTPEEAVTAHAYDTMSFAIKLGAGIVNDVFLQYTHPANERRNGYDYSAISKMSAQEKKKSAKSLYAEVTDLAGDWWNYDMEVPDADSDVLALGSSYSLGKLAFLAGSLSNPTLGKALDVASVTGFDVLGQQSASAVEITFPINFTGEMVCGWRRRAERFNVPVAAGDVPVAVLLYDRLTETFDMRPEVVQYLHQALREQNKNGLDEQARKTGGNLAVLEPAAPISRGCPVAGTGLMPLAAGFAAKTYQRVVDLHKHIHSM